MSKTTARKTRKVSDDVLVNEPEQQQKPVNENHLGTLFCRIGVLRAFLNVSQNGNEYIGFSMETRDAAGQSDYEAMFRSDLDTTDPKIVRFLAALDKKYPKLKRSDMILF